MQEKLLWFLFLFLIFIIKLNYYYKLYSFNLIYEYTKAKETTKTLNSFTSNISMDEIKDSSFYLIYSILKQII